MDEIEAEIKVLEVEVAALHELRRSQQIEIANVASKREGTLRSELAHWKKRRHPSATLTKRIPAATLASHSKRAQPIASESNSSEAGPTGPTRFEMAYCPCCRSSQAFFRHQVRHGFHALMTIITVGLWSPFWILARLMAGCRPWRCVRCGWHKPEFSRSE